MDRAIVLSVKNLKKVYSGKIPFIAVGGISFDLREGEILGLFWLYGLSAEERRERTGELLERFEIASKPKSYVSQLSTGQITRLMLVKAFMIRPKVALRDELTASLDSDIAKDVIEFVFEQREKFGTSTLYTSHNMAEVAEVCDRILFLKQGKIVADDIPENLAKSVSISRIQLQVGDGMKKIFITILFESLIVWLLYALNIFAIGRSILPFCASLLFSGWFIGFLSVGIMVYFGQRVQMLAWMTAYVFALFSAIFYPLSTLPDWEQAIGRVLPMTYIFEGMRKVLNNGVFSWQDFGISGLLNFHLLVWDDVPVLALIRKEPHKKTCPA
jgi:ABC-type Na+ transport system ATPase subunit NatA